MKVRIGNDIRLQVQLSFAGAQESVNILSLKAVFINRTLKDEFLKEYKKKNRFIHRFPIEPFSDEFQPTEYNIHSTGNPRYRAFVMNQYNGFGVYPDWKNVMPFKKMDITEYVSKVSRTQDPSSVVAVFPASVQKYAGEYDLIVTAQVYDDGYEDNVRTVTVDYKNVFELVSSSEESDVNDAVQISINNISEPPSTHDYFVISGSYDNNEILLQRNDNATIHVDIDPVSGWYEQPEED